MGSQVGPKAQRKAPSADKNSLESFYAKEVAPLVSAAGPFILDLGCGGRSFFSSSAFRKNKVIAIDKREDLIIKASQGHVSYYCMSALDMRWRDRFDVVMDSHLLSCMPLVHEREQLFLNISKSLRAGGLYAIETLTYHSQMSFDEQFYFSRDKILYTMPDLIPIRTILTAYEIEKSLLKYFDIVVFKIPWGLKYIVDKKRVLPRSSDPDVLRIVCRKKQEL